MNPITKKLFDLRDEKYAEFQAKLTPTASKDTIIGVRVPLVRSLAKELAGSKEANDFIHDLPHTYYDENMLHGLLLSQMRNFDACVREIDAFLPYVDNWAVCDITSPKVFGRHKEEFLPFIKKWVKSKETYRCRFAIEMLMSFYLDKDFKPEYLDIVSSIRSKEYYVNMMIAWFFATALAKKWESAIKIIENNVLDVWTHNKTIQKARESYRITPSQKEYLKSLKR